MKVMTTEGRAVIYPFAGQAEGEMFEASSPIVVYPEGGIILWANRPTMHPETARKLAQALLHAVELAETGKTG